MNRATLMQRDLDDVAADLAFGMRVIDRQSTLNAPLAKPSTWDTSVVFNTHDTKIVLRQHRHTGALRIKVIPARDNIAGYQPEPYELELMPDFPFHVLTSMLEILK